MPHRVYEVPAAAPTIVCLHPAYTTPEQFAALIGPMPGFRLLFPEAKNGLRWDHLGDTDAPYVRSLGGDYVLGFSSGAFMAARMTFRERQYKGLAMCAGGVIKQYANTAWPYPCPVLLCHGTADLNVPYKGTTLTCGAVESAQTIARFLGAGAYTRTRISNASTTDGCGAYMDNWADKVRLYTVENGGHSWPGRPQDVQKLATPPINQDFSLSLEIGRFFEPAQMARAA